MKKIFIFSISLLLALFYLSSIPSTASADYQGTKNEGDRCEKSGKNSCDANKNLVCDGFRDNFGPFNTLGTCKEATQKEGDSCVPNTGLDCASGFSCEGNFSIGPISNGSGKCVAKSKLEEPCKGEGTSKDGKYNKNWGQCDAGLICIRESGVGNDAGICVTEDPNNPGKVGCVSSANASCLAGFGNCCQDSGMSCVGAQTSGTGNKPGKCIVFANAGEECLGDTEAKTGRYIPKCKPEFDCEGASLAKDTPGKCVNNEVKKAPPPEPGPCPEKMIDGKCPSFNTALGNIKTNPAQFIGALLGILLAVSGAIAILLIIRAGYKIMTSEGKPEPLQEGRERLIAAIVGLLFIIFSLVFLQVIGFDILRIPGITGSSSSDDPKTGPKPTGTITDLSCMDIYSIGSTGRCVQNIRSFFNIEPVDGAYDKETEDAVIKFQRENDIYEDGDVGPCTTGKMRGHNVDPVCKGPLNDATLRQFQRENGLVEDGKFGGCTWRALIGDPIPESCTI